MEGSTVTIKMTLQVSTAEDTTTVTEVESTVTIAKSELDDLMNGVKKLSQKLQLIIVEQVVGADSITITNEG